MDEKLQNYRLKERNRHLLRTYGISNDEYDELLEKQNHCCAVCSRHESEFATRLAVDHDHHTMEIRGLLCNHCNHRVVGRHRDTKILKKVVEYLEKEYTGWFVPKKKKRRSRSKKK